MIPSEIERLLPKVQKPARYCGGEINTIIKDKSKVTTRVAFCFPDLYEVGMSHLGMKLFYSAFNKREEICANESLPRRRICAVCCWKIT